MSVPHRSVTSLGHLAGRRVFWQGPKSFKPCPTHFLQGGRKVPPPWLRAWFHIDVVFHNKQTLRFIPFCPHSQVFHFNYLTRFHLICTVTLISYVQLPSSHMCSYPHLICTATLISYAQLPSSHMRSYSHLISAATLLSYAQLPSSHMRSYPHLICAVTLISYAQLPSSHMRSYPPLICAATLIS